MNEEGKSTIGWLLLIICTLLLLFLPGLLSASAQTPPESSYGRQSSSQRDINFHLKTGEKFVYTLSWGVVPAGFATMEVDSPLRWAGVDCYRIKISTKTNSFLDKIYKVRDTVTSLVETSLKRSQYYRKEQQEGSFRRDDELTFDYQKEEAILNRDGKLENVIKIRRNEDLLDPFAVLYYVRSLKLKVGGQTGARVTDGKAVYQMQINVLKREKVKTWAGYFDCLKIEPKMKKLEGIFQKKLNASLYVWLTDDERRIPVKMQSEVFFGSVQGLLKEIHEP